MNAPVSRRRPRVVVCGTKFGRVYMAACRAGGAFELAGILALGSERSQACARHFGVPLYTTVDEVPADIDIACVVIGSAINGGRGVALACDFMKRGVHVLQEHPVHYDELVQCLRTAREESVCYRLNTLYVHVAAVQRFISLSCHLRKTQPVLFVDVICSIQVFFTVLDILGRALGGLGPWHFHAEQGPVAKNLASRPFRTLSASLHGVPVALRVQHQLDPSDPDNYSHIFHRITLGTEGGQLTLANTYGPLVWTPRAHMPDEVKHSVALDHSCAEHFDFASATVIGPAQSPSYRRILASIWPDAVVAALTELQQARVTPSSVSANEFAQHYLAVCRSFQDATQALGAVELLAQRPPRVLDADTLLNETRAGTHLDAAL